MTTETLINPLRDGAVLGMLTREFAIDSFSKVPRKRRKKDPAKLEAEKVAARAAGKSDDIDGDEDDPDQPDEDRFAISISSEFPVQRWGAKEILDHSPESVDLSRAKTGLSFLDSHNSSSIIGIVHDVAVKDKKLRGVVQFSRSAAAQDVKRDVQDGIRQYISVGYSVDEYELSKSSKDEGDTYRATKWTPMEASSVAVPADPTVGHNRKAGEPGFPVKVRSLNPTATQEETVAETSAQVTETRNQAVEIIGLGTRHGIEPKRVSAWIAEGKSVADVSREILDTMAKPKPIATPSSEQREELALTEREQNQYNLARGIMAMATAREKDGDPEPCLEVEISQTLEKTARSSHGGLFVPWTMKNVHGIKTRAGLDSSTATVGAELKFTEPGVFIDYLYNRLRVKQLGAQTISGLRDNVAYPKQTGRATGSWVGENPGVDVADSNLTLGQVLSSPKTYQSSTSYSRQLLAQAVVDVDTLVRQDLARDLAISIDLAAIAGTGANFQPTGVLNASGITSFILATDVGNGGLPTYPDIAHMIEQLEDSNADQLGDPGWLTTPAVKALLKLTPRMANTIALPVWTDNEEISGLDAFSSNQVPKTGVRGSTSNNSALILGVWSTMIIGMWGSGFELVVDPYRLKKQGMIELTTFMLTDIALKYPAAFVVAECQTNG
jgi:HK97 family phage major capsid protein